MTQTIAVETHKPITASLEEAEMSLIRTAAALNRLRDALTSERGRYEQRAAEMAAQIAANVLN